MLTNRRPIAALLSLAVLLGGCAAPLDSKSVATTPDEVRSTFTGPQGLWFDAVVESPPDRMRNGWAVLMIGGGFGNDLDWTTPGRLDVGGETTQMTINGEPHADAPRISAALVSEGFTVMRWSTIARSDPLADQWPLRATPRTLAEMVEQSRAALEALRRQPMVDPDRVILLGHSLGAARGCTIAADDEGVRALILLSPAYFTRPAQPPDSFEANGMRFGAEVLEVRTLPCLLVCGERDGSRAVDASGAEAFARNAESPGLTLRTMPDLGHQLGPQEGALLGPIDERVIRLIADWAADVAADGGGGR